MSGHLYVLGVEYEWSCICVLVVEYERSCICVLGVEYERSCICVLGASILYQARKVSGVVLVC